MWSIDRNEKECDSNENLEKITKQQKAKLHGIQQELSSIEIRTKVAVSFATNQFKAWKFETEEWERKKEKEIDGDKEKDRDKEIDREQLFILLCHNFTVILWQPSLPPFPLLSSSITQRIQFD